MLRIPRLSLILALAGPLVLAPACSGSSGGTAGGDDGSGGKADNPGGSGGDGTGGGGTGGLPSFTRCVGRDFTPAPATDWRHIGSNVVVALGDPNHSAQDLLIHPSGAVHLVGRFTYGLISKDLEDEDVEVFFDQCGEGWDDLGSFTTDGDGRVAIDVPDALGPGVYEARFEVLGDQSTTSAFVWVLPEGTHVVVSDIDGTMTSSDFELFKQILAGSYVPMPYPGAIDLTQASADRGWVVMYLTGRPYYLSNRTRTWLTDETAAAGPLHLTDTTGEALPTQGGVGNYKLDFLQSLVADGYVLDMAYGNASTDISAYLGAGIPADKIWIIGSNGGNSGTNAVTDSWAERAAEVAALPPVDQPFSW